MRHRLPPLLLRQSRRLSSHAGAGPVLRKQRKAPTLSLERWSLAVCLGDKTVFSAAWLCCVGPGAGTGSRVGWWPAADQGRAQRTESTECGQRRYRDSVLTPHTPDPHSGIGAGARDPRVAERAGQCAAQGWRFGHLTEPKQRHCALFQHKIRGGFRRLETTHDH